MRRSYPHGFVQGVLICCYPGALALFNLREPCYRGHGRGVTLLKPTDGFLQFLQALCIRRACNKRRRRHGVCKLRATATSGKCYVLCNLCQLTCNLQQTPFPSPLCASVLFLAAHLCVCVSITTPLCKMSRASNMQKCSEHAALLRGWCNYAHNLEIRRLCDHAPDLILC